MKKLMILLPSRFFRMIFVSFVASLLASEGHFVKAQAASNSSSKPSSEVNVESYLLKNKPKTFNTLKKSFERAVDDTQEVELSETTNNLWALSKNNKKQKIKFRVLDGKTEFLMSTWMTIESGRELEWKNKVKQKHLYDNYVWVTPAPQVKEFCHTCKGSGLVAPGNILLNLRLQQYLGLKLESVKTHFIEIWVKEEDLMRPCIDEEINDSSCAIIPSSIPGDRADLVAIKQDAEGYPWTGLGYTYDWGNPPNKPPIGASEFVIKSTSSKKVEVEIESVMKTKEYCNNKYLTTSSSQL
ncbi:hypothetical protein H6F90_25125 [Trichocoleus sp. FACHB-591]|uniref:hypothetical protein n=1 Tax=Trichocoleus sp. FACHB-591 TaxID=2692872 RepID=UPI0016854EBD|nr:hypothetical protein [Trichocoleus sp. FACHB-591]MBD2098358.1 hypothetical protein [Trichocoleus sp. FACHB-591]